ncbi:hypothetical protein Dalu01_01094 [Deinococcus aluminii]|uniref:Uncharacterized protein n=1 Tax=Deinococcus aluminii TaxID=1656885 RepID=A0ABP9XDU7_9DEIO
MTADEGVTLQLTRSEAPVLFEWLARNDGAEALAFEHEAEQQVIRTLEGQLEKGLREVLDLEYAVKLAQARSHVMDAEA